MAQTVNQNNPRLLKLNLFALPSQTAVLFALIVSVILAAVVSGAIGPSPLCVTPILAGIILLPLRAYLAWPDREIARYALRPADESCAPLQAEIAALSERIGLHPPPRLLTTECSLSVYTFGSFRRRYVAMGIAAAHVLMADLAIPVSASRALLLHELYHFRSGDVWQMGYARELLRTVTVFLSWSAVFFIGLILLMIVSLPGYLRADLSQVPGLDPDLRPRLEFLTHLDPVSHAQVGQKANQINLGLVASFILNSLLPMIVVSGVGCLTICVSCTPNSVEARNAVSSAALTDWTYRQPASMVSRPSTPGAAGRLESTDISSPLSRFLILLGVLLPLGTLATLVVLWYRKRLHGKLLGIGGYPSWNRALGYLFGFVIHSAVVVVFVSGITLVSILWGILWTIRNVVAIVREISGVIRDIWP